LASTIETDDKNNPNDSEIKETVCYGRHLDEFFVSQNTINKDTK